MVTAIVARASIVATAAAARPRTSEARRYAIPRSAAAVTIAATQRATLWFAGCSPLHQVRTAPHAVTTDAPKPVAHHLLAAVAPASMRATLCGGPVNTAGALPAASVSVSEPSRFNSWSNVRAAR